MKKIIITIATALSLVSCSKKTEDFVGVHNFKVMDDYIVQDTTEFVNSLYGQSPLTLKVKKLIPFKIDLFKSGDEIKGTLTITEYQVQKGFNTINQETERKVDFKNIHLVNDTLIAEISSTKRTQEFKIAKSGNEMYLIVRANEKESQKEACNKLAAVSPGYIIYSAVQGSSEETKLINESNSCAVETAVNHYLEKGYKFAKKDHLKEILSVEPK